MQVSLEMVRNVFEDLVSGRMSRDAVDRWAYNIVLAEDDGDVTYIPAGERERIRRVVNFLYGCDIQLEPGKYLHSEEDLKLTQKELFDN